MSAHDLQWFLEEKNEDKFAALNTEQMDILMKDGTVEIDDTPPGESAAASSDTGAAAKEVKPEPVLLAKDGVHTIPFAELETARAKAVELEALTVNQAKIIAAFEAAGVKDEKTETTTATDKLMNKLREEYPDLSEDLIPILKSLGGEERIAALEREIQSMRQQGENSSRDTHFLMIEGAHPDYEQLLDSGSVSKWVDSLPAFAREGASQVLKTGTAEEVIELFTSFKQASGMEDKADSKEQIELAAKAAVDKAKQRGNSVTTLTDIPAAGSANQTVEIPHDLAGWRKRYESGKLTEKQIMADLNR